MNGNDASRTTLYQLAALDGSSRAEGLRRAICTEALLDDEWREMYDQRLASRGEDPENAVLPSARRTAPAAEIETDATDTAVHATIHAVLSAQAPDEVAVSSGARRGHKPLTGGAPVGEGTVPSWLYATLLGCGSGVSWALLGLDERSAVGGVFSHLVVESAGATVLRGALFGAAMLSLPVTYIRELRSRLRPFAFGTLTGTALTIGQHPLVTAVAAVTGAAVASMPHGIRTWRRRAALPAARSGDTFEQHVSVQSSRATTLYGTTANAAQAVAVLRAHASRLGAEISRVDEADAAAAMIGADAWMFALGASWFDQAASFGPVSVGAISAVLARAAGEPVTALPDLGGDTADDTAFPGLEGFLLVWGGYARRYGNAAEIMHRVADDLMWAGGGNDRLSRIGRSIRLHAQNI